MFPQQIDSAETLNLADLSFIYDKNPDDRNNANELQQTVCTIVSCQNGSSTISKKVQSYQPCLRQKLQEVMEEFCSQHQISLAALERRLAETKQTRTTSTWILWQRSNLAKRSLRHWKSAKVVSIILMTESR